MVNCFECDAEFIESDSINECNECDEIVCSNCKEKHNCVCSEDEFNEHENYPCEECSNFDNEMYQCPKCDNYICGSCQEQHIKSHQEEIEFQEYDYKEYVKEKTIENL